MMKRHFLTAMILNLFCFLMLPGHALAFTDTITIIPMPVPEAAAAETEPAAVGTDVTRVGEPEETSADPVTEEAAAGTQSSVLTAGGDAAAARVSEEALAQGGPGVSTKTADTSADSRRGESLGMFTTTGYCNCSECNSSGFTRTWSGTVPAASHTIAADLDQYPIGTRLMIGDIIYTVEDMGPDVSGSRIDIYYDNHDDAVAHGMKTEEVFTVLP